MRFPIVRSLRPARLAALALCALSCGYGPQAARADTLSDLNSTLKGLQAAAPVKGVLDVTSSSVEDGDDPDKPHVGRIQLDIAAAGDLTVHLGPAQMQAVEAEETRHAADPNQEEPTADLLRQFGPAKIGHMVSAAEALLATLDGASSPTVKAVELDGTPATELSVTLPERLSKKDSGSVRYFRDGGLIWLDAKGTPLQFQETVHAKFCKFFLCISVDRQQTLLLRVVDGRLVAVRDQEELKQSGLGQGSDTKTTATLQLQ